MKHVSEHPFINHSFITFFLLGNIIVELPIYSIVTGIFNARCSMYRDSNVTNLIGFEIDKLTSAAGYKHYSLIHCYQLSY